MQQLREEEFIIKLGLRIKEIRKAQKLAQTQLAFEAGLTRSQIVRIETGKINTSVSQLYTISKALDVDIKCFFEFD
ncbi:MAG: helix-turn-helix domain-containing protein [Bacteroidia bacterium]|nr:helix-turn-helix transcriptional regulator [Bacteroidia bacterium]MCO5254788.1 helix-turn-helix domain-containing protein [Bacteroidota bacterium]MCZ2128900.1 helix-turn-helix domain-containing protein [Bacteroidia bacterium]